MGKTRGKKAGKSAAAATKKNKKNNKTAGAQRGRRRKGSRKDQSFLPQLTRFGFETGRKGKGGGGGGKRGKMRGGYKVGSVTVEPPTGHSHCTFV
jgi:hypothetical protein